MSASYNRPSDVQLREYNRCIVVSDSAGQTGTKRTRVITALINDICKICG